MCQNDLFVMECLDDKMRLDFDALFSRLTINFGNIMLYYR